MSPLLTDLLARTAFPPGDGTLVCAVSGGADSMALLALAAATGRPVLAIHVDHGLRPGSASEAGIVGAAAERFGAAFEARRVVLEPGPNLEARARAARYAVLPDGVLTGHTADDQAETIVMNLMRGAGLNGLAGMRPEGHPLLRVRRHETRALCRALDLTVVEDPSNESPDFLRNRVRNELLPLMNGLTGRDVAAVIASEAEVVRRGVDFLDAVAANLDPTDARAVSTAHPEVASRALREWVRAHLDDDHHPPDRKAVERMLAVARGDSVACDVSNGLRVRRSGRRLHLERVNPDAT